MAYGTGRTKPTQVRLSPAERAEIERLRSLVPGTNPASTSDFLREGVRVLAWLIERHGSEYRQAIGAPATPLVEVAA